MNAFWNLIADNKDVAGQIEELNGKIRELVEQNSPRLVRDYYKAIDFPSFCRIQKKYAPNTPHNTFSNLKV